MDEAVGERPLLRRLLPWPRVQRERAPAAASGGGAGREARAEAAEGG